MLCPPVPMAKIPRIAPGEDVKCPLSHEGKIKRSRHAARPALPPAEPALVLLAVQGTAQRLAGQGARMRAVVEQHLAIDDHIIDPHRTLPHVHLPTWELMDGLARRWGNSVGVENGDIGGLARSNKAPVMQV